VATILIVDDEADVRETVEMILDYEGYRTVHAAEGEAALAVLGEREVDAVLLDIKMPGRDGMEILEEMRRRRPELPVVMISGHGTISTAVEATKKGAFDFIEKPLDRDRILLTLRNAVRDADLVRENRTLRDRVDDRYRILGESEAIAGILETVRMVAPTQALVLITGDNGTGKELVARNIHQQSPRWKSPFVEVNCAAIPRELIESELFGHEKGAFTGASARRKGKYEQADGGTLFLDEIGDMDAAAQAKVLRVLEDQRFERVGGAKAIEVDVRVIAATNKDLQAEVEEGNFREDLFYRLNVVPIRVPALRERREDIPILARAFLEDACERNGLSGKKLVKGGQEFLERQEWPGNVRQLRNLMERAAILTPEDELGEEDLARHLAPKPRRAGDPFTECDTFEQFKDTSERLFLEQKLTENGWNVKRTAERLGMQRSNLYKKIEKHSMR
jgi:two-component system nitrogen regulation response regulator NtrX